ncbi:tripartite tricarboxylate transporter TctB family protein [Lutibaculum baratangense]|nr:tripartite tricarboxylate transporter TctB family protein [Lutibaculum baratangense]
MSEQTQDAGAAPAEKPALDANELIIPVAGLIFAVYYISTIWDLPWGAKMSGLLLGVSVLVLCILFLLRSLSAIGAGRITFKVGEVFGTGTLFVRRFGTIALAALYVALMPIFGFALGTFLFLMSAMALLGVRVWKPLVGVPFILAATGYLLFVVALRSRLPEGVVGRLVGSLTGAGN